MNKLEKVFDNLPILSYKEKLKSDFLLIIDTNKITKYAGSKAPVDIVDHFRLKIKNFFFV